MTPDAVPTSAFAIDTSAARTILFTFLLTFLLARITVLAIMLRWIPTLYLRVSSTHVHHLNYGIFLLSISGALVLVLRPQGGLLTFATILYATGLGLTFDEFGMWLHLGGPYWQRISFDAVITIAALFGLIVYAPALSRLRPQHWTAAAALVLLLLLFIALLTYSMRFARARISPVLQNIEARGPAELPWTSCSPAPVLPSPGTPGEGRVRVQRHLLWTTNGARCWRAHTTSALHPLAML
jgi:hypothetical protein